MSKPEDVIRYHYDLIKRRAKAYETNDRAAYERLSDEINRNAASVRHALSNISEPALDHPAPTEQELFLLGRVAELNTLVARLQKMLLGETPIDPIYLAKVREARAPRDLS